MCKETAFIYENGKVTFDGDDSGDVWINNDILIGEYTKSKDGSIFFNCSTTFWSHNIGGQKKDMKKFGETLVGLYISGLI